MAASIHYSHLDNQFSGSQDGCGVKSTAAPTTQPLQSGKGQVSEAGVLTSQWLHPQCRFMMMAASECFLPSIIVAVKFFDFKFAVFYHALPALPGFLRLLPKSREYRAVYQGQQGGLLSCQSNPIAVLRLYEYGIGMDGFVSVLTSILAAISVLKRASLHDGLRMWEKKVL